MSKDERYTRCKQCGKIIVGSGKLGLCDSCFNADAKKAAIAGATVGVSVKYRKEIWKFIKKVLRIDK